MQRAISLTHILVLTLGSIQLVLGVLFWFHIGRKLVPLHIIIGSATVLVFVVLAVLSAMRGAPIALAVVSIVIGVVAPYVGLDQKDMIQGNGHWIIQVIHLLLGMAIMGLASSMKTRTNNKAVAA